ncbi:adenylate cyclase [Roseibium aquae]|uniref:Adenylate cyclase n=1 Tax=Roseibium aquae TaxID=1323746 RepID=A0A916TNW7_9HYPH|nr:adenylate/guanylate cyclase domain-containing protein [Roseibium aquae]GGB61539.1 adenylate cyclase [Roseibium aquae]
MTQARDIDAVEDWLIGQALASSSLPSMFGQLCDRLRDAGLKIDRTALGWSTLHPLIEAEMAFWESGLSVHHETYAHNETGSDAWLNSPMRAALFTDEKLLRRRLTGTPEDLGFPILTHLAGLGYSDYFVLATGFEIPALLDEGEETGILVSWATKAPGGFSNEDLETIAHVQKRFALAARASVQAQITETLAQTYLGGIAGKKVLAGQIRRGDGERIAAVIFYSDMRHSTEIAEALGADCYITWLNSYFEATAGPVIECGGEILDFIGDAVLAVFPIDAEGLATAVERALRASGEARRRIAMVNASGLSTQTLKAGIALSVGDVMFGNIGIPERLSFSVIGQTVHAAARIEALTKQVGVDLLITKEIADLQPKLARPVGSYHLSGFSADQPLFTLDLSDGS